MAKNLQKNKEIYIKGFKSYVSRQLQIKLMMDHFLSLVSHCHVTLSWDHKTQKMFQHPTLV